MADHSHDSLFREIDEELRQEQYTKLWKRYGAYVITGVVALVAAVGGYQGWRAYDVRARTADGNRFEVAAGLAAEGQTATALQAFTDLARDGSVGYRLLARFNEAALLARTGDAGGALATYVELAEDGDLDPIYRDLATVLGALQSLTGGGAPGPVLTTRLDAIVAEGGPWRHSAREVTAVLALRSGDQTRAGGLFTALRDDAETPEAMRARATEMLAVLEK